jgi:hypothetical protein
MLAFYTIDNATVMLQLVLTNEIDREAVFDGPSYMYTRHVYRMYAHVNRRLNYILNNTLVDNGTDANPAVIVQDFGIGLSSSPIAKDNILTKFMLQPRGQLLVMGDDGTIQMQSPRPGFRMDANGGPTPLRFRILNVGGSEDLTVYWEVEVNEHACTDIPLLLSHRWRQYRDCDQDGFVTRHTEGTAYVHMGLMDQRGIFPDELVAQLIPDQLDGFRRGPVRTEILPDNEGVRYSVVDEQLSHSITRVCTRMECIHRSGVVQPGLDFKDQLEILFAVADAAKAGLETGVSGGPAGLVTGPLKFFTDLQKFKSRLNVSKLPQHWTWCLVRCWGDAFTARNELQKVALAVLTSRLEPLVKQGLAVPTYEAELEHDVTGKYVSLSMALRHGPGFNQVGFAGPVINNTPSKNRMQPLSLPEAMWFPDSEDVARNGKTYISNNYPKPRPNYKPPFGPNGTSTGLILAQFIQGACSEPAEMRNFDNPMFAQMKRQGNNQPVPNGTYPFLQPFQSEPPTQDQLNTGGQSTLSTQGGD